MLQPDPGKKKRYSGTYRKNKSGKVVEVTPPTNPINFGKYGKFFTEEGNTVSGARSLKQLGKHYNTDAFKANILPQLQELNPDTDFHYEGNTYKCGGKMYAQGGELKTGELTEFNEGGSHEEHPEGGIPQGVGDNGLVNRVEEGETKVEDYVYSDTLSVGMDDLKKFNLPSYVKGKTFAEATKMIDKRFEDKKDNASMSTKKKFMERTMEAQEEAKEEIMLKASNDFSLGGILGGASDMAGGIMGDQEKGKVGEKQSVGGATAKYALMGATAGSVVPGIGTAIGAGVGAIAGYTSATMANKNAEEAAKTDSAKQTGRALISDGFNSLFLGGFRNSGGGKSNLSVPNILKPELAEGTYGSDIGHMDTGRLKLYESPSSPEAGGPDSGPEQDSFVNKGMAIAGGVGALTPIIGNIVAGNNLRREDPNRFHTAGRTYQPTFVDDRGALNAVNEAFAGSSDKIAGASGGDLGAYRAGMRGVMANKAAANLKAYDYTNRQQMEERRKVNEDFTTASREAVSAYNQEQIANKQDRAAYDAAKQVYRNATYEGLSQMGNMLLNNSIGDSTYDIFGNKIMSDEEKELERIQRRDKREAAREARRAARNK